MIISTFESNVILNRFKTQMTDEQLKEAFESNVILNRFKTIIIFYNILY